MFYLFEGKNAFDFVFKVYKNFNSNLNTILIKRI